MVLATAAANKALSTAIKEGGAYAGYLTSPASALEQFAIQLMVLSLDDILEDSGSAEWQDLVFRAFTCGAAVLDSGSLAYRLQGPSCDAMASHTAQLRAILSCLTILEAKGGSRAMAALRTTTFTPAAITHGLRAVAWVEKAARENPGRQQGLPCGRSISSNSYGD